MLVLIAPIKVTFSEDNALCWFFYFLWMRWWCSVCAKFNDSIVSIYHSSTSSLYMRSPVKTLRWPKSCLSPTQGSFRTLSSVSIAAVDWKFSLCRFSWASKLSKLVQMSQYSAQETASGHPSVLRHSLYKLYCRFLRKWNFAWHLFKTEPRHEFL